MSNPFQPRLSSSPPVLAGREIELDLFDRMISNPGSPDRNSFIVGPRGSGKTALLTAVEDQARSRGWIVVSTSDSANLVEDLSDRQIPEAHNQLDHGEPPRRRLTGASLPAGLGGASWEHVGGPHPIGGLRSNLSDLARRGMETGTGVLITVDEIHAHDQAGLKELCRVVNHCFRENLDVAVVGAGLSSPVRQLVFDPDVTFMAAAQMHRLGPLRPMATWHALVDPLADSGRGIGVEAAELLVDSTQGHPLAIQLAGYHAYESASDRVTLDDAQSALQATRSELRRAVVVPTLRELSDADRSLLVAIADHTEAPSMRDLAQQTALSVPDLARARHRLVDQGLLTASDERVDFALPDLRTYLRRTEPETLRLEMQAPQNEIGISLE